MSANKHQIVESKEFPGADGVVLECVPIKPKWNAVSTEESVHETTEYDQSYIKLTEHKWMKLCSNSYFWSRFIILILSLILFCLSLFYCIGQLFNVRLDLITECPNPKTRQEIWEHSYHSNLLQNNNKFILNEQSQYGFTDESCWTTKKIEINTNQIWNSNRYISEPSPMNYKCILFGIVTFYVFIIILYNVINIILDIIYITQNKLHTKSIYYKQHIKANNNDNNSTSCCNSVYIKITSCFELYNTKFGTHTTAWIIRSFISEIIEFILQSQALLLYNGYNLFDPNNSENVYLANKYIFIILFAAILSFNCFGSGLLWFLYAIAPKCCNGLRFKISIYFVDQFSDLFYALFPFIVIFFDSYNQNTNDIRILFGALNVDSTLAFLAAFVPLFLSCNKCLFIIRNVINEMRNNYYDEWKKPYDAFGHRAVSTPIKLKTYLKENWSAKNAGCMKKLLLIIISILFMVYGIFVSLSVVYYLENTYSFCNSVKENKYFNLNNSTNNISISETDMKILQNNPELFFWDNCRYKTYPFAYNNKYKCQCRVFVIFWNELNSTTNERHNYFNLTQEKVLSEILSTWYMLEKFKTVGSEKALYIEHILTSSMYKSVHMRAFEWQSATITLMSNGISTWNKLEYLKLEESNSIHSLPKDFGQLQRLKYLSLIFSGLQTFPLQVCELTQLNILQIQWDSIQSIPECIKNLVHLKQLLIDINLQLSGIPLSVFTLPKLIDLSLFQGDISYYSLLEYNVPSDIPINDTELTDIWFNDNFKWNNVNQTSYWLSKNPICDEDTSLLPIKMQQFINETNTCFYPCDNDDALSADVATEFCIPMLFGDGKCDKSCNYHQCYLDHGDCVQACFANTSLTNCSWQLFTNDICDDGCNNEYCSNNYYGSDFKTRKRWWYLDNLDQAYFEADLRRCFTPVGSGNYTTSADTDTAECDVKSIYLDYSNNTACQQCIESDSIYIDYSNDQITTECQPHWINDGMCDDSCRTTECNFDGDDCLLGCVDDYCFQMYQGWAFTIGASIYKINHSNFCNDHWAIFVASFQLDENINCMNKLENADYNNDGQLNFREFVVLAIEIVTLNQNEKASQVNCSSCVGMQYYNV